MQKKQKKLLAMISAIIIIVAVAYYYTGTVYAQEGVYTTLTIHYTDGTSRILSAGLSKQPMEIIDPANNKLVESVEVKLHMISIFDGPVNSYTVNADMKWDLYSTANVLLTTLVPTQTITYTGGILHSGDDVVVYSYSLRLIGGGDVTDLWTGWVDNTLYYFRVVSMNPMSVTLNFGDPIAPTPMTRTISIATMQWQFRYDYPFAFTSLSASWTGIPTYSPYV